MKVSYSDVGEGGVAVNCEKNTIFPEHPVVCNLCPKILIGQLEVEEELVGLVHQRGHKARVRALVHLVRVVWKF